MTVAAPDRPVERIVDAKRKALDLTQARAGVAQADAAASDDGTEPTSRPILR